MNEVSKSSDSDVPRTRSIQQHGTDRGSSARGNTHPSTQGSVQRPAALRESAYSLGRSGGVGIARRDRAYPFSRLVLESQGTFYNIAYRILGDPELAAFATEAAFLRASQAFPGRRGRPPELWIMRLVVATCQEQLRPLPVQDSDSRSPSPDDYPEASCAALFDHQSSPDYAQVLLNALPPDQRVALVLSDVQGLSYREIADVIGATGKVIRSRLSQGRTALRNALLAKGEFPPGVQP
jgi:RNA polymerase sigma-70 factor (ECF subfamily)